MSYTAFHAGRPQGDIRHSDGDFGEHREATPTVSPTPRSSSGLGCEPFTLVTRVRTPSGVLCKECSKCGEDKPHSDFNRKAAARDGLQSWCRACHRSLYRTNEEQREKAKARALAYGQRHPEKKRAWRKLNAAIESGRITRGFCESCGSEKTDAHHHRGYDRPLDVQWLCRSCHVNLEPRRGAA